MKIFAILPAYNAQKTLIKFFNEFPWDKFTDVILVDDYSSDETYKLALKYQQKHRRENFYIYQNSHNLGYGGNLIRCLSIALDKGADAIVELHPDGEYGFDGIDPAIEKIKSGADLVLGNRFSRGKPAGMYWSKYLVSRALTFIHCKFSPCRPPSFSYLRPESCKFSPCRIPDLHQGFRVYSPKLLEQIPFHTFSFDYLFSWQIILAALRLNLIIKSVPVTASYRGSKRGARWWPSIKYTIQTLFSLLSFRYLSVSLRGSRLAGDEAILLVPSHIQCSLCHQNYFLIKNSSLSQWSILFCRYCRIAFTHPQPTDISKYYGKDYWQPPGLLGKLKLIIFRLAQHRRINWIQKYLSSNVQILDVGAGEGIFGTELAKLGYQVTSLDTTFAHVQNKAVEKVDFLTWDRHQKFAAITFWESFEHVATPASYLTKAKKLLKSDGLLFIEYPRYDCWEANFFGRIWFNLDLPRHLYHFTETGLHQLLKDQGFTVIAAKGIWAAEYSPWGLVYSFISRLTRKPLNEKFRYGLTLQIFLFTPLFLLATIIEFILFLLGASPIGLIVAKK